MSHILQAELIHETDKAFLIQYKNEKYWLPKSYCQEASRELDFEKGSYKIILSLEDWLAYKKGFTSIRPYNYSNYSDYDWQDEDYDFFEYF